MTAEEKLDDIEFGPVVIDPRTAALLAMARRQESTAERSAAAQRRREAQDAENDARAQRAFEQRVAVAVLAGDGVVGEVESDPVELEQRHRENDVLASQAEAAGRERRLRLIEYDHRCDRTEALRWLAWEDGEGPRPAPVMAADAANDDPLLDELTFDVNGKVSVVRGQRFRRAAMQHATPPQDEPTQPTHEPTQLIQSGSSTRLSARCSICASGHATQIAQALSTGASLRGAAKQFGFTESALRRHRQHAG